MNKESLEKNNKEKTFYLVSVDMGYGHQRAAYPFFDSCYGDVITANNYQGATKKEVRTWKNDRASYEAISSFKDFPVLGDLVFSAMDYFQRILPFYPRRDLSRSTIQQKVFFKKVKNGLSKNLIKQLNEKPLPLLTTFFVSVYAAEYYNYKGDIYCVVCDADISRSWAPIDPKKSNTKYLAPNQRVKERLMLYGVKPQNIYVTGFPLPKENVGANQEIVREDLIKRLAVLDPNKHYRNKYGKLIDAYLCKVDDIKEADRPFTLSFAVGGAGAQKKLGATLVEGLKDKIKQGKMRINIIAGSRPEVRDFFQKVLVKTSLQDCENIRIIYSKSKLEYFKDFNQSLRHTDVLWTKPSELSFYSGLGLPIIMAEPIGSQEHYNRRWLLGIGAGIDSKNPKYVAEWLFDFLESGWLAEAAMQGFLNASKMGTYNIESLLLRGEVKESDDLKTM